jgi:phospholipase/carboxylesterase
MTPSTGTSRDDRTTPAPDAAALRRGPERAERRLVLLHGWGADADDLLDLGSVLVDPDVSVVALRAPEPHPAGMGRQWYDLQQPQWPGVAAARIDLLNRLEHLAKSVPLESTALLGFSQGAAMALDVATGQETPGEGGRSRRSGPGLPLAGLVACSGYPHPDWRPISSPPVLITHGETDPVVPYAASTSLAEALRRAGATVRRVSFPGGHGIDPSLFAEIRDFLDRCWMSAETR